MSSERTQDTTTRLYFDHAASSWPKPSEVVDAVDYAMTHLGGNPGRGAYDLAMRSARAILEARRACARLLGVSRSEDIAFVPSCTFGCNQLLFGLLGPGDRVVVGATEHNAVVRPLNVLAEQGVEVDVVPVQKDGYIDPEDFERVVRERATRAVVCQHANNVTGVIHPVADLADIAHENDALMLVDGAQAAGHVEVDFETLGVDGYALSGHKGILGPQGIGALYLSPAIDPRPLIQGGTGSGDSGLPLVPSERPDRYEAGTGNTPGIVGLGAAARWHLEHGSRQRAEEQRLVRQLHEGLVSMPGVTVLGPPLGEQRVPLVSFTHDRVDADRIAFELDHTYGIATRAGLHCSPASHRAAGTLERGAVRMGVGFANTNEDVAAALEAVGKIFGG